MTLVLAKLISLASKTMLPPLAVMLLASSVPALLMTPPWS
jgi:hypothetical protein